MSTEENKELVREFIKEINVGKGESTKMRALFDKFYSRDFVAHSTTGDMNMGQYEQYIQGMVSAFPDYEFTLAELIAGEDKVAIRMSWSGTHKGEIQGIPPTGKRVNVTSIGIWRIADDKFIESWSLSDTLGMMQQLGASDC